MGYIQKQSAYWAPTLKEDPAEAELVSHKLLLRAGMIRKTAAGLYSYLPLAYKALLKIEQIIREEMQAIGAQEMMVPQLTPAELWEESGRLGVYGPELMRLTDRHDREFCLGPTHEETFVDLVRDELRSYKQLPVTLYQIQDKFRDEIRPRFGLMRGREFIMKDAYTFAATQESLQEVYEQQKDAYARIAARAGIHALPVVADSGQIGGDTSVEFMALADSGEAGLVWCECGYAADKEAATSPCSYANELTGEMERVATPQVSTIDELCAFLGIEASATRKALALIAEDATPYVCIIPGDHELNEVKAEHLFGAYHLMSDEELKAYGLVKGFMGPVGLPANVSLVVDMSLRDSQSWIVGGNEQDVHLRSVCPGRDFEIERFEDLIEVREGDPCPHCQKALAEARGIEISQVFQLGTKYSEAMGATFMDTDGTEKPFIMGCYGIGVSRMLAAVVEQHADEKGIAWPISVAPFEVQVLSLAGKDTELLEATHALAQAIADLGMDVLFDDRNERAGVKFADADLMGMPIQVIVGKKNYEQGLVEVRLRKDGSSDLIALTELPDWIQKARATLQDNLLAS